jgi:hypothetical protein
MPASNDRRVRVEAFFENHTPARGFEAQTVPAITQAFKLDTATNQAVLQLCGRTVQQRDKVPLRS